MRFSTINLFCIILIIFCGKFLISFVKFRRKLKITLKFAAFLTVLAYFLRLHAYLFSHSPFVPYAYHLFFNFPLIFFNFSVFSQNFPLFSCFPPEFFPLSVNFFSDFLGGLYPPNPPQVTPLGILKNRKETIRKY